MQLLDTTAVQGYEGVDNFSPFNPSGKYMYHLL
jgi:hypothetical protein